MVDNWSVCPVAVFLEVFGQTVSGCGRRCSPFNSHSEIHFSVSNQSCLASPCSRLLASDLMLTRKSKEHFVADVAGLQVDGPAVLV